MGISDEFRKFGARQKNVNWSVSAFNSKNELVVSIWAHKPLLSFDKERRVQIYTDEVNRWSGHGKKEFKENLDIALNNNLYIRAILAKLKNLDDLEKVISGEDASPFPKTFSAKINWIGSVTAWDGENFTIEFFEEI
jgi:hypothetical protein